MPEPNIMVLAITGIASAIGGGGLLRWTMRRQLKKLKEADVLVREANATSVVLKASLEQVEGYRRMADGYMEKVEALHSGLMGAKSQIAQLELDLTETIRKLKVNEDELERAREIAAATVQELTDLRSSHRLSRQQLDQLGAKLRDAELRREECESHRASLEAELTVLKARLDLFTAKRPPRSGGQGAEEGGGQGGRDG